MEDEKVKSLRTIALFASLTDEELNTISRHVVFKQFNKNEVILHEEDTNEVMYIILSGKVKVFQTTEDGKETILAIHSTGEFFGEMSLLDGETAPATVSAKEKSLIALISKGSFYSLLYSQKKVLEKLLNILCFRLRESWKKIHMLNFRNAYQRVKMSLMMLVEDHGMKSSNGITLHIKLTHQDIADMTGLTRETVTRVLDRWQRDGEITILKNRYILLSPHFLAHDFESVI